jgi:uncharacterized protein (TIGR03435 family)
MLNWRTALLLTIVIPCLAQTAASPAFDVASIRPTQQRKNAEGLSQSSDPETPSPGTFRVTNNSLLELIGWAYRVHEYQISGPKWLSDTSKGFDIEAKMPPGTPKPQLRLMVRTLLEERFTLATHHETRTLPVYELGLAKGGPKLDPVKPDAKAGILYEGKFWSTLTSQNTSMADFARFLGDRLGRPVIDTTGVTARFPVHLEYRISEDDTARPSLFAALQEKLGLVLKTTKGPVEILVIDRLEKEPSAN